LETAGRSNSDARYRAREVSGIRLGVG